MNIVVVCFCFFIRILFNQPNLDLYAGSAVLMDGESGRVLYGKQEDTPMANASTTKIMTCILVLENCGPEEELQVSFYAETMPKVKLYIRHGETYRVEDLLYSLMLESHNDSAVALAEYVGRKWVPELEEKSPGEFTLEESMMAVKAFAQKMNEKAKEIGCEDTYFITPNGLDATETIHQANGEDITYEHHTTAEDLARIMSYCILSSPQKEEFLHITGTEQYGFSSGERYFTCVNHNSLLTSMDCVISGKTGFTGKAGYCYVGAAKSEGRYYVAVVLACGWPGNKTYKWSDTRKLLQYGMENYHRVDIMSEEMLYPEEKLEGIEVTNCRSTEPGRIKLLDVRIPSREHAAGEAGILLRDGEKIRVEVACKKYLEAPVALGEKVGVIRYLLGDEVLFTEEIVTAAGEERVDYCWCLSQVVEKFLKICNSH